MLDQHTTPTHIAIDHDADGAFAVITRPGAPAERVELTHQSVGRLAAAAMEAWLAGEAARKSREKISGSLHDATPPHFIGAMGE